MQAIGIEDKRPLWEMRVGGGGCGGNIRADPTLGPRAQLGGKEKLWAGGIAEAGEKKEGNGTPKVAQGEETLRDS